MKYPFFSFINKLTSTRVNSFGTIIEPINKIDGLREKIEMVVLMEYFPIQIKPNNETVCLLKENYVDLPWTKLIFEPMNETDCCSGRRGVPALSKFTINSMRPNNSAGTLGV